MNYNFEWDPSKAKQNIKNHDISFERSASIFIDPRILSIFDDEHSEFEERWISLGIDENGILLVVCHTYQPETKDSVRIRIFSSRKANKKEILQYKES